MVIRDRNTLPRYSRTASKIIIQNQNSARYCSFASGSLEDLVREMLKPMLKAWLDDNLPNMVERLVRAEIERVSRGRG